MTTQEKIERLRQDLAEAESELLREQERDELERALLSERRAAEARLWHAQQRGSQRMSDDPLDAAFRTTGDQQAAEAKATIAHIDKELASIAEAA